MFATTSKLCVRHLLVAARRSMLVRSLATESRIEHIGFYPNTIKYEPEFIRKVLVAKCGDDAGFQPVVFRRGYGTEDQPNLVPMTGSSRLVGCTCYPESTEVHHMIVHRDELTQCKCMYYFKGVDASTIDLVKEPRVA